MAEWEAVIGLEIHAQLKTDTKIFCGCSTRYGAPPNSQVCPVCLGHPGVLPVLNRKAVDLGLRTALAIEATVNPVSIFARKNYFYPDLPKGYQVSQYDRPLCEGGSLGGVRFNRIHLEEDAGKSIHPEAGGEAVTRLDLNRCGTPLMEIVTEPDIRSPGEAHAFLTKLKQLLLHIDVNDGNMEEGSLRCDGNISVRPKGQEALGTKVEIKNLNSFRNVEKALEYEIARQIEVIEGGGTVIQETRLWDADRSVTRSMRGKEEAHDYRYFPEPDLKPLVIGADWIEAVRATMPELPAALEARLVAEYGLPAYDAGVLASTRALAAYYEEAARVAGDGKLTSNWVMTEILRLLKEGDGDPAHLPVSAAHLGGMVRLIAAGTISGNIGKTVFEEMAATGKSPDAIIREKGLESIGGDHLDAIVREVLEKNPGPADEYRNGKEASLQFLVGQGMKISRGRAEPKSLRDKLVAALKGS